MKKEKKIGISQIGIELPKSFIPVEIIEEKRIKEGGDISSGFAQKGLGTSIARIPYRQTLYELAAEAIKKIEYKDVETFFFATESNPDASKPVIGLKTLKILGLYNVVVLPITFACVSGIESVVAGCKISAGTGEPVIVVAVDRSIYAQSQPRAEVTEGCAAVAVRIEPEPELIKLDYQRIGVYVADIDDWKIPWASYPFPKISDELINIGYPFCIKQAFLHGKKNNPRLIRNLEKRGISIIDYFDYILPHCPFLKMTEWLLATLWQHERKYKKGEHPSIEDCLKDPELYPEYKKGIDEIRKKPEFQDFYKRKTGLVLRKYFPEIGNPYSVNSFIGLVSALEEAVKGQKIGVCSFGSGAGSINIKGTVKKSGFKSDIRDQLNEGKELTWEEYNDWRRQEAREARD